MARRHGATRAAEPRSRLRSLDDAADQRSAACSPDAAVDDVRPKELFEVLLRHKQNVSISFRIRQLLSAAVAEPVIAGVERPDKHDCLRCWVLGQPPPP